MKTKIAIQGELGAYSHLAAKEIFGDRVPSAEEVKAKAKEIVQKI